MRDPLYKKILEGLADSLDWRRFEECACDLLRDVFPSLVQVGGSGDFGMDGEITDDPGGPFPLVCTTSRDTSANLRRNLDRYLEEGGRSRKVVLATSQDLTPVQRKKLKVCTRKRGFELIGIFDRRWFASRLYRDSKRRLDLLGISGDPPALTAVPRTRRPLVEIAPLGRDADIEWLRTATGDRVLAGQPGSGKTYLLYHLIHRLQWSALFLDVESGRGEIADALRDLRPKVVVVDDAHVYHDALERLIALRAQLSASFSIVATTWPSGIERVVESLGGSVPVWTPELLSRREIQAVIQQVGITVAGNGVGITIPDEVMRELIEQSANRPGLAVTLAQLMCRGAYKEVLDGSALSRTLLYDLGSHGHARSLLAALGLGGDRGIRLDVAAEYLGIGLAEANEIAGHLLAGLGVLQDRETLLPPMLRSPEGATLSVWPQPLRWQLVKSFYFESPPNDYRPLLGRVASRADGISTLLQAKARGAEIGTGELGELVRSEGKLDLWQLLAEVGEDEARWALEHYPGDVLDISRQALARAPAAALPRLLRRAAEAPGEEPGVRRRSTPWEILLEWIRDLPDDAELEQAIERREHLALAGVDFLARHHSAGAVALFVALDPGWHDLHLHPASGESGGDRVSLSLAGGALPKRQLEALAEIWRRSAPKLTLIDAEAFAHAEDMLRHWLPPRPAAERGTQEETKRFMRDVAAAILRDLRQLVAHSPGLTVRLEQLARLHAIEIELHVDPIFKLLYASFDEMGIDRQLAIAARLEDIGILAQQWHEHTASEIAAQFARYEKEAKEANLTSSEQLPGRLAQELAQRVSDPVAWFQAFLDRGLPALAVAFSERIVAGRWRGWEEHLSRCFELAPPLPVSAAELIFRMPEPPGQLMEPAMRMAKELPWLVRTVAHRQALPIASLSRLLRHSRWQVALAAAVGECNVGGSGNYTDRVREEIRDDWRKAILGAKGADYDKEDVAGLGSWLPAILRSDPQLALDWLERRLSEPDLPGWFDENGAFARAAQALSRSQRAQLLAHLPDCPIAGPLVRCLVERDPELFTCLLARSELRAHHLGPLRGSPDEAWGVLASMALDAGYTAEDIAKATGPPTRGEPAPTLADHPDLRLREVARCRLALAPRWTAWIGEHRRSADLKGIGAE